MAVILIDGIKIGIVGCFKATFIAGAFDEANHMKCLKIANPIAPISLDFVYPDSSFSCVLDCLRNFACSLNVSS